LKSNVLPRGLVPLEDLFDFNDVAKKPKIEASGQEVEDCNIGTEEKPKMVKLSKSLPLSRNSNTLSFSRNIQTYLLGVTRT
jgi:hypothetical protein